MIFDDTIVAAATPYGYGGIAVVRLSGKETESITLNICRRAAAFKDRRATIVTLYGSNKEPFDSAVVTFYKHPNSYTGEDIVEFSCHGSPTIVEKIIEEAMNLGARTAEPGEFTHRAFVNGKLDLVQAESVAAVIHGQGEKSVQLNHRVLSGELSKKFKDIKQYIIDALSHVEFELDVSEDNLIPDAVHRVQQKISSALKETSRLAESFREGRLLNRGASVVITGPPNIGKSTLFNVLLNENRAIVSAVPGTTRDVVDASVVYGGISIMLTDTAGIRSSDEEIESEGIRRATEKIKNADVVLSLFDVSEHKLFKTNGLNGSLLPVLNKCDLYNQQQINKARGKLDGCVCVSAKTGDGIENLKNSIKRSLCVSENISDTVFLITQRQYDVTNNCINALNQTLRLLENSPVGFELLSVEIREALDAVDRILGKTTSEDILNNIFSNFCVGK